MEPDRLQVIQGDSRTMTAEDVLARAGSGGVRIFSVDGSHTAEATLADVTTAAGALAPGGVIVIGAAAVRAEAKHNGDAGAVPIADGPCEKRVLRNSVLLGNSY
jgi:cephalosporin hydroxylase